jgi:tetratricopeptide (TPR) repeat protein
MRTPVITIFVVCVLVIGLALAFYDYKKHGVRTEPTNFSKSEGDTLKRTKESGDEQFLKENYEGAVKQYQRALQMWPRDAHLYNDLGASYYRLGLQSMDSPMAEDEFDFGVEVDARYEGAKPLEMVQEKLAETKSGIITAVVGEEADKTEIETYARSQGKHIHVEVEDLEDGEKEYWLTILTGKTKDEFLKAERAYLDAINIKSVRDDSGRRHSTYPSASRNLGTLYFRMGRKKEAVAHWQRALQLEPTDAELRALISKYE